MATLDGWNINTWKQFNEIHMGLFHQLHLWDQQLFLFLNGNHHPVADEMMWLFSEIWIWIPLYVIVSYVIARKWKKKAWWILLVFVLCVVLTDQLSNIIKETVHRFRPSRDPSLIGLVHLVNGYTGGKFGFVSAHTSNSFGFAILSSSIFKNRTYTISIYIWAAIVSYSRIYLGVHYPGDVIGGAFLGLMIGAIGYFFLRKQVLFPDRLV